MSNTAKVTSTTAAAVILAVLLGAPFLAVAIVFLTVGAMSLIVWG